jgi:hypothetical protein
MGTIIPCLLPRLHRQPLLLPGFSASTTPGCCCQRQQQHLADSATSLHGCDMRPAVKASNHINVRIPRQENIHAGSATLLSLQAGHLPSWAPAQPPATHVAAADTPQPRQRHEHQGPAGTHTESGVRLGLPQPFHQAQAAPYLALRCAPALSSNCLPCS